MAIEAKNVRVYVSRILMLLMEKASPIIQRHPYISGAASLFSLVFWFLPFVFNLLLCSVPVILCAVVIVRVFFCSENLRILDFKGVGKKERKFPPVKSESCENAVVKKHKRPRIEPQMSKRRNFKYYDTREITQAGAASIRDDMLVGRISDNKESVTMDVGAYSGDEITQVSKTTDECFLDSDVRPSNNETAVQDALDDNDNDGNANSLEVDTLEEAEDEDEEEAQDDNRNQAVEWTEDDQKNVMDLGFSEMERNRRLENLIAKRRAKKFLGMKVQENLLDADVGHPGHVPPVQIAKTNPFNNPFQYEENLDPQAPGSAPSIMLPSRNPFDLPYDPHEEKPDLSVHDSNQEFLGVVPKDIFRRHGSFSLGPSFSAETADHRGPMNMHHHHHHPHPVMDRSMTDIGYSRFRLQSEKGYHDKLIEEILYHRRLSEGHEDSNKEQANLDKDPESILSSQGNNDVQENNGSINLITSKGDEVEHTESSNIDTSVNEASSKSNLPEEDNNNKPISSSSPHLTVHSTESEDAASLDDRTNELYEPPKIPEQESLPGLIPNSMIMREPVYDSSPSAVDSLLKGIAHSATHSIASDMHVEVSEAGSSHNTMDGMTSPSEVESSTYEVDVEGKGNPVDEEIWKASSYQSVMEGNESRSEEISHYMMPNAADARSFDKNDSFNYPTQSLLTLPEIIGQDSVDGLSTSSSAHQPESADDTSDSNELKSSKNDSPLSSSYPHSEDSINFTEGRKENNDGESSPTKLEEITELIETSTEHSYSMIGQTNDAVQEQETQLIKGNLESSFDHEVNVELEGIGEKASHGSPSETELIKEQETQHIPEGKEDKPEASIRDEEETGAKEVGKDSLGSLEEGENKSREQIHHETVTCSEEPKEMHIKLDIPQHGEGPIRGEEDIKLKEVGEESSSGSLKEGENEIKEQMDHVAINCSEKPEEVHINSDIPQHVDASNRDGKEMEHKEVREESIPRSLEEGENNSREQMDDEAINCSAKPKEVHINSDIPQHVKASIRDGEEMEHKEVQEEGILGSSKEGENNSREQVDCEAINCLEKPEEVQINSDIPQHVDASIRDGEEMKHKEVREESILVSLKEGENNSREQVDREAINCLEKPQEVQINSDIPQHVEASIKDGEGMERKEGRVESILGSLKEGENNSRERMDRKEINCLEKPKEVQINSDIPQHVEASIRDGEEMEHKEVREESILGSSKEGENNSREQMDCEAINCLEKTEEVQINSGIAQHVEASIRDGQEMEHKEVPEESIPVSSEEGEDNSGKQINHEPINSLEKLEEVHINSGIPQHAEASIRDKEEMEQKEVLDVSILGSSEEGENNSREQMDREAINCLEKPGEVHINSRIPQHVEASVRDEEEMEQKEVGKQSILGSSEGGQNESMKQLDHEAINCSEKPEEMLIHSEISQHE